MRSKIVKVVLIDGTPYGAKTAELSNWNGKAIIIPRATLKRLRELPEANMPAVYFLLGEDRRIYVGETDSLANRMMRHATTKDFWDQLIAFTSPKLTKTEVRYLEHILIKRLKEDGLVNLVNEMSSSSPTIAVEDMDVLSAFIDNVSDILLSLGYRILGVNQVIEEEAKRSGLEVVCTGPLASAQGVFSENGLLVLKGSLARAEAVPTFPIYNQKLREQMLKSGILKPQSSNQFVFTQDHLFSSPSPAAGIVLARSANGWLEWKTTEGKTLNDLEQKS